MLRGLKGILALVLAVSALSISSKSQAYEPVFKGTEVTCSDVRQLQPDGSETKGCYLDHVKPEHKFTILTFMSITCGYCVFELPTINQLAQDLAGVATLREISIDRKSAEKDVMAFYQKKRAQGLINYPFALDQDRKLAKTFNIVGTPTTFIVDSQNKIIYSHVGMLEDTDVAKIKEIVTK